MAVQTPEGYYPFECVLDTVHKRHSWIKAACQGLNLEPNTVMKFETDHYEIYDGVGTASAILLERVNSATNVDAMVLTHMATVNGHLLVWDSGLSGGQITAAEDAMRADDTIRINTVYNT